MSKLDFEKYLAEAQADLDAEKRARIESALTNAVNAAEAEARRRADEATQNALERHQRSLEGLYAELGRTKQEITSAVTSAGRIAGNLRVTADKAASEAAEKAIESLREQLAGITGDMASLRREGASLSRSHEKAKTEREALEKSLADAVRAQDTLRTWQDDLERTQAHVETVFAKARRAFIAAGTLALIALLLSGWIGIRNGQQSAQAAHAARLVELSETAQAAQAEAEAMEARRAGIEAELQRIVELREEIGLELVRDDSVVEIRLGDVVLRPWRGHTLVIVDDGRELEPFSGGASLNGLGHYRGRMFRTTALE